MELGMALNFPHLASVCAEDTNRNLKGRDLPNAFRLHPSNAVSSAGEEWQDAWPLHSRFFDCPLVG